MTDASRVWKHHAGETRLEWPLEHVVAWAALLIGLVRFFFHSSGTVFEAWFDQRSRQRAYCRPRFEIDCIDANDRCRPSSAHV
jgi:hypothetical protein